MEMTTWYLALAILILAAFISTLMQMIRSRSAGKAAFVASLLTMVGVLGMRVDLYLDKRLFGVIGALAMMAAAIARSAPIKGGNT